jgi:NAD-dependent SIR2 family protein deacetylase
MARDAIEGMDELAQRQMTFEWRCDHCRYQAPKDHFPMNPRQGYIQCPRCGRIPERVAVYHD